MKKLLRFLMLAVLFLPFALQAQNTQTFDFEDNAIPADFTNDATHPWVVTSSSQGSGHSGTYCIMSGNAGIASSTSTITATFTFDGEGTISFLAGIYGEGTSYDKCIFKIDSVEQFSYGALATWATYTFDVEPGSHTFEWTYSKDGSVNPTGDAFYIDDIVVDLGVATSCFKPTAIALGTITDNSIDITWTPAGTESSWIVSLYDENNDLLPGYPDNASVAEYSFAGLDANTSYKIGVKADCGGEISAERTIFAHTACEAVTDFPWTDDFESYTASSSGVTFSDPCWVNEHISGNGTYFFEVYSGTSATGGNSTQMLRLHDMSSGTMTKLVLPLMDLPADNYAFSIDVYRNSSTANYGEGVRVYASTNGQIDGATELAFISRSYTTSDGNNIPAETESGWYTYTLPIGISGNCYIILRGESRYGSATYMDNFVVDEGPTCIPVSALAVDTTTTNSITLIWADAVNSGASYTIYDMSDSSVVASGISDLTYTVESLNANTSYTFGVVADCGGDDFSDIRIVNSRTDCDIISELPFTEDFEAVPSGSYQMPFCWNRYTSAYTCTATYPYSYSSSTYAHGGSRSLYFYGTTDSSYPDTMAAILPELDVNAYPMNLNRVVFWARMSSTTYDKNVYVYTMSDPTDLSTLTLVDSVTVSSANYTKYTVGLLNAPATDAYVMLAAMKGDGSLYIDDLTLDVIPACPEIEALTVSAITADGATLSWTGNADSYTIYDMSDNSVFGTANDVTFTLTNLEPMTNYTVGVTANCGSDESPIVTVTFNTACTAVSLPYTETFEENSASRACWTSEGDNEWTIGMGDYSTSTGAYQGSQNALITHVSTGDVTKLVSPILDGVDNGLMLNFAYVMRQWVNDIDELRVYSRSAADSAWQQVAEYTAATSAWTTESLVIPGTVYQIAFEMTDGYGYGVGIDNVALLPMGSDYCFAVNNLAVSGVTSTSVSLTWHEIGNATSWNIAYGPAGTTPDSVDVAIEYVYDTTATIDNLTPAQTYDFYVQANCGNDVSDWVGPISATPGFFTFGVTGSSSITACGLVVYDNGGPNGNYSASCDYTLTVYPSEPDSVVSISGTLTTENNYDYLYIYNGTVVDEAYLLASLSGSVGTFGPYSSETGPLTLRFKSDSGVQYEGFSATVTCVAAPDCVVPYDLSVNATSDAATITWTNITENAVTELYYKEHGDSVYTTVTASEFTDGSSYEMTNLTPATTYDVYVANICDNGDTLATAVLTFSTTCVAFNIYPFVEDFANNSSSLSCWSFINANNDDKTFTYSSSNEYMYYPYHSSHSADDWLISPVFVLDGGQIADFDYWSSSSWEEKFQVFAIGSDSTVALSQVITVQTSTHQNILLDLSGLNGEYQIGIHCVSDPDKYYLYIDNFRVRDANASELTVDPTSMSFSTIAGVASSAQMAVVSSMALNNDIDVTATAPFEVSTDGVTFTSTVTVPVNTLFSADTLYVRYNPTAPGTDNGTVTLAGGSLTATIALTGTAADCSPRTLPYSENFDSYTNGISSGTGYPTEYPEGDLPSCWLFPNRSTSSSDYPMVFLSSSSSYAVSGNCLFFKSSSTTPLYAVLPDFIGDIHNMQLHFTYRNESTGSSNGTLSVGYMTDPSDVSTFNEIATFEQITTLTTDTVFFTSVPASVTTANIVFKYTGGNYNNYYLSIDDVYVVEDGSGPVVTDPTVATAAATAIEQTTATLNATITNPDNVSITAKGFEWKATTGGTYTQIAGTGTGNTFTANLTGLTPNTGYTYKAFITYNGTTVYGNEMTFTTLEQGVEPCDAPTGLTAGDITGESIAISWNASANAEGYNIQYSPQGGTISSASSTTNSYTITGLAQNTTYQIQVQANCGDGNLSGWSESISVTTTGIDNYLSNSIALYPNPANEYVDVRIDGDINVTGMEVFDVYGKLINTVNVLDNPTRINVSGLANGMYFVRVTTDEGVATKTFVKK